MIGKIISILTKWHKPTVQLEEKKENSVFNADIFDRQLESYQQTLDRIQAQAFQKTNLDFPAVTANFKTAQDGKHTVTFDAYSPNVAVQQMKQQFSINNAVVPQQAVAWYGAQSFIGYQMCAILAQNWLIDKACAMPGNDAIRKGFEITVNSGEEVAPEILEELQQLDIKFKLNENLSEFIHFGRVFGVRVAMFVMDLDKIGDPLYYEKPFNLDGVTPGSYKGISQIDPNWIMPQLDADASGNPASMYFFEPTWWIINGVRVHRTHLIIMRNSQVADVLKPSYYYGGIPVTQLIYQRVFAAENTANEAPKLAANKRNIILKMDIAAALAQQEKFEKKLSIWSYFRDNFGTKIIGKDEEAQQLDTSLADLDAVIMTQYQLVAAAARVPVTKLLGTTPKGFNATGEFDESSYHEELETIQSHHLTPLINRHHELVIRSAISPKYGIAPFSTQIKWHALDAPTAKEKQETNFLKAQCDEKYVMLGALDGEDVRQRLINDPDSGYNGITTEMPEPEEIEESPEEQDPAEGSQGI